MTIVSTIVATAKDGVIGKDNAMPWYLPAELAHFKELTMGHPIIMGRKTHESIGRSLPGRMNIVISRDQKYQPAKGSISTDSLEKALKIAKKEDDKEVFIIGGQSIYQQAMPLFQRIYLTKVQTAVHGDKFFKYDPKQWKVVSSEKHPADDKNKYAYEFLVLERQ